MHGAGYGGTYAHYNIYVSQFYSVQLGLFHIGVNSPETSGTVLELEPVSRVPQGTYFLT